MQEYGAQRIGEGEEQAEIEEAVAPGRRVARPGVEHGAGAELADVDLPGGGEAVDPVEALAEEVAVAAARRVGPERVDPVLALLVALDEVLVPEKEAAGDDEEDRAERAQIAGNECEHVIGPPECGGG